MSAQRGTEMGKESAFLRVGNTLYRGRNGTLDFSNHKEELALLPPETATEIVFFEIVDDPAPLIRLDGGGNVG